MKYKMYTVFDKAAQDSSPPFFAVTDAVAARQFRALLKNNDDPDDFEMYYLGTFDSDSMDIESNGASLLNVGVKE